MRIFNATTKELFGCISFISPFSIFRFKKPNIEIVRMKKYCYVFPQKCYVMNRHTERKHIGSLLYKYQTLYWLLCWKITVTHVKPEYKYKKRKDQVLISEYQLKMISEALRFTSNLHETHKRTSCFDRTVDEAQKIVIKLLKVKNNEQ